MTFDLRVVRPSRSRDASADILDELFVREFSSGPPIFRQEPDRFVCRWTGNGKPQRSPTFALREQAEAYGKALQPPKLPECMVPMQPVPYRITGEEDCDE